MKLSDFLITPCAHMVTALALTLLYVHRQEYIRTFDCCAHSKLHMHLRGTTLRRHCNRNSSAHSNVKLSDFLIAPCAQMVAALVLTLLYLCCQEYVSKDI